MYGKRCSHFLRIITDINHTYLSIPRPNFLGGFNAVHAVHLNVQKNQVISTTARKQGFSTVKGINAIVIRSIFLSKKILNALLDDFNLSAFIIHNRNLYHNLPPSYPSS